MKTATAMAVLAIAACATAADARVRHHGGGPRSFESSAPGYIWVLEGNAVFMKHEDKTLEVFRASDGCAYENAYDPLSKPVDNVVLPVVRCNKGDKTVYVAAFAKAQQVTIKMFDAPPGCADFSVCTVTESGSKPAP